MTNINYTKTPTEWLVASYDLNGNALDSSGNWNDWTSSNVTWVASEKGYTSEVGSFNGSTSYISTVLTIANNMNFTYVYKTSSSSAQYFWYDISNNNLQFRFNRNTETDSAWYFSVTMQLSWTSNRLEATANIWSQLYDWNYHTLSVNINQSWTEIEIYFDNVKYSVTNSYTNNPWVTWGRTYYIWGRNSNWTLSKQFTGNVWLFKFYNKLLSTSEINNLYQEWLRKYWPVSHLPKWEYTWVRDWLVAEYSLNNNTLDSSWNGNNWTPTDVTYSPVWWGGSWNFNGSSSNVDFSISWLSNININFELELNALPWEWVNYTVFMLDNWNTTQSTLRLEIITSSWIAQFRITRHDTGWTYISTPYATLPFLANDWFHFFNISINTSNWQHLVDIDNINYINYTNTAGFRSDVTRWTIWSRTSDDRWANAKIWLFKIYNKVLSTHEIDKLYQEWLKYIFPQKYSLPNLEQWKVLEISRSQYTTNTYADESWNWNTWTATNVTDSSLGLNNIMSFNGVDSLINVTHSADFESDAFWIETWLNPQELTSTDERFIYKDWSGNVQWDWQLFYQSTNSRVEFNFQNWTTTWVLSLDLIEINKWYHIIITSNWTTTNAYINWILVDTSSISWSQSNNSRTLLIWWESWNFWENKQSNVIMWNRFLSDTEVKQKYYSNYIPN